MLSKFSATNFKGFGTEIVFDLNKHKSYEFSTESVKDDVLKNIIIYGENGSGKSNLGLAIFDIVSHVVTNNDTNKTLYSHYLNASANHNKIAEFSYEFIFEGHLIEYKYGKKDLDTLVYEDIKINNEQFAFINRELSSKATINAVGAESLKKDFGQNQISIISYIRNNAILDTENIQNRVFLKFIEFIQGMLFFRTLRENNYIGLEKGAKDVSADLIKNIDEFQMFLDDAGLNLTLTTLEYNDEKKLGIKFPNKTLPFFDIASQGTISLALFYYWFHRLTIDNKISFVFIDEFDAFYHHSLAKSIVNKLKNTEPQIIITTHNTSIMTNDLLRPDCYFIIKNNTAITPLSESTSKELREAHNLEKMYRSGAFNA